MMEQLRLPIPAVPTAASCQPWRTACRYARDLAENGACRRRDRLAAPSPDNASSAVVVLCDISGSMAAYARMLLHFLHVITSDRDGSIRFCSGHGSPMSAAK